MTELEKNAFRLIRRNVVNTRAELSRQMGISRPTASVAVDSLLRAGVVREAGKKQISRGKSPTGLEVVPESFETIGIDVGYGTRILGVRIDAAGNILQTAELESPDTASGAILSAVFALVEILYTEKVCGMGVALAAVVDEKSGMVLESSHYDIAGEDFAGALKEAYPFPVMVGNRARMAAFSEQFGGAADRIRDFLLLSLGKSIGSSICLDGGLYCGISCRSGEIRDFLVSGKDGKAVRLEEAMAEDRRASVPEYVESCACCLRQLIALFDLKNIVLFGRFRHIAADFPGLLNAGGGALADCRIFHAAFGDSSGARGAALAVSETGDFCIGNFFKSSEKGLLI